VAPSPAPLTFGFAVAEVRVGGARRVMAPSSCQSLTGSINPSSAWWPAAVAREIVCAGLAMAAPNPSDLIGQRDRAILETLYGTGLRLGEVVRADLSDLDLQNRVLLVRTGKGRKDRLVPIGAAAATALDRYLTEARPLLANAGEPAVFVNRSGARLQAPGLRVRVQDAGQRIGVRLTPHALRHSYATHLLRDGADLRHVQALLGHRSLTTTAIYTRAAITDLRSLIQTCHPRDQPRRRRRRTVE